MKSENAGLAVLLGAIGLSVALLVGGLIAAGRIHDAAVRRELLELLNARAAAGTLTVLHIGGPLDLTDPAAKQWEGAPVMTVALLPQNITMPAITQTAVAEVQLQALTDGQRIAWRLSWADSTPDLNVDADRFSDAAALQFPLQPNTPYMMGGPNARVQVLQWRALWQKDADEGFQDVQDLHPNYWADLYWFAQGARPFPVPAAFTDPRSHAWFPALQAGNPQASWSRRQPVAELMAEGFGTLTPQSESASMARGVWSDGRWRLVVCRPLVTQDPLDYQFSASAAGQVAVAIWEGAAGNVGGRKQYSNWIRFEVGS
jgi:hypothetical protein